MNHEIEVWRLDGSLAMLIRRGTGKRGGGWRCSLYHATARARPRASHRVTFANGSTILVCLRCARHLAEPRETDAGWRVTRCCVCGRRSPLQILTR